MPGYIGECAVAVVAEENVVSPERAKEVVPTVVVVIADADAGLPAAAAEARFCGHVGKRSVAIVAIKLSGRRLAFRPGGKQARAVGEINIEPAVLIVIEKSNAAAFGLDDVLLVVDPAPDIRSRESGFTGYIHKLHLRGRTLCRRWRRGCRGFNNRQAGPSPRRRAKKIEDTGTENGCG